LCPLIKLFSKRARLMEREVDELRRRLEGCIRERNSQLEMKLKESKAFKHASTSMS